MTLPKSGPPAEGNQHRGASKPEGRVTVEHSSTRVEVTDLAELDVLATRVDGSFVLVVKVTGGTYRRRCFLTAASAQRAAERAIARGENATVYLAELKPLYRLVGGESR